MTVPVECPICGERLDAPVRVGMVGAEVTLTVDPMPLHDHIAAHRLEG